MSIKGIGEILHRDVPQLKTEKTLVEPQKNQAPIENKTRAGENAFGSSILKESLNRMFDKSGVSAQLTPTKAPTEPPIDYFEIDKQADELIKKHTDEHWYGDDLKTGDLGKEVADIAKTDPQRAAALTDNILDKIDGGDKDELSQSIVESMSPEDLRKFAGTEKGKETLDKLKGHLDEGWTSDDEDRTIAKINTALKSAELEKSPEFQKLDKATQKEVLTRLESNATNEKAVDNLIELAKDGNFQSLSPTAQKSILGAYDNHKEDAVFVDGLKTLAGKANFKSLNEAQQNQVVSDLDKFANTESYKGTSGFLGIGGHNVSDADKKYLLDNIGNTAILSASDPTNTAVRNTLDKILSNDVRIETYSEPAKDGRITFGTNNGNGVLRINTHPDANNLAYGANKFTDTIVHELNHQLNPGADHGTPEQFLNEYRAFYVGLEASGTNVDAATQKDIIDNLVTGYKDIKELYESDSDEGKKFKKFIDDAKAGLDKTPPELLDPEKMRTELDALFDDDYLNKTGNIDNH